MKKRFAATALTVLLLAGCGAGPEAEMPPVKASPTPSSAPAPSPPAPSAPLPDESIHLVDDGRDAFEVDTGGTLGTVLVTVEIGRDENGYTDELTFCIWDAEDAEEPIQTIISENTGIFRHSLVADANFDGYMDFGYMYAMGNQPQYYHFWLWDEEARQFVAEPMFDEISCPQFDPEQEMVTGYARSSCCSGVDSIYRWEDGALVCVRRVEVHYPAGQGEWETQLFTVEDRVDGVLREVRRKTYGPPEDGGPIYDEEVRWYDLNYHGENEDG